MIFEGSLSDKFSIFLNPCNSSQKIIIYQIIDYNIQNTRKYCLNKSTKNYYPLSCPKFKGLFIKPLLGASNIYRNPCPLDDV